MSFAPKSISDLAAYWVGQGGVNLGIVGNAAHTTGYHIGKDRIYDGASGPGLGDKDYSVQLARDKAGLTNAAAALDLGKLNGGYTDLRAFSVWLVDQCKARATGTDQVREVIYSPDGTHVKRWDNHTRTLYNGGDGTGQGDNSHLTHTHISFYRDTQSQSKISLFTPYFGGPMGLVLNLDITHDPDPYDALVTAKVSATGNRVMYDNETGDGSPIANGLDLGVCQLGTWVEADGTSSRIVAFNYGSPGKLTVCRIGAVDITPLSKPECPPTDCTDEVKAATDPLNAQIATLNDELTTSETHVTNLEQELATSQDDLKAAQTAVAAHADIITKASEKLATEPSVQAYEILIGGGE